MSDISIKGKSPILKYSKKSLVDKFVKKLAGGVEGKPHTSKEGIEAAAGRKFSKILKKVRPVTLVPTVPKMPKALGDKLGKK